MNLNITVEKKSYPKSNWKLDVVSYPREKVQIDIKYVPNESVLFGLKDQKYYQITAIDEYTRERD